MVISKDPFEVFFDYRKGGKVEKWKGSSWLLVKTLLAIEKVEWWKGKHWSLAKTPLRVFFDCRKGGKVEKWSLTWSKSQ